MVHVFRTTIPLHTFYHSSHAHIEGVILQATSIDDLADAQMLWHGVVVDFPSSQSYTTF